MTANGKHGSVQEMLPLEEIVEGVLCLRGGEYRAVIQAQSVNFALKSEEEQEAVMAAYRSFLNSLSHPVQMLVRILPTNVEPYLAGFRSNVTSQANSDAIRRLALDHRSSAASRANGRYLKGASTSSFPRASSGETGRPQSAGPGCGTAGVDAGSHSSS